MRRIKPIKIRREPTRRNRKTEPRALGALLNLGPKSSAWLIAAGIESFEDLRRLGPIETCRRIRAAGHPVSVLMAYALEGALTGTHWNSLSPETKQWLRAEFAVMKRSTKGQAGAPVLSCSG